LKLCISGVSLASLLYRITTSNTDLEGFLFGTISRHRVHMLEDSQTGEKERIIIGIQDYKFIGAPCSFYDGSGTLNVNFQKAVEGTDQELLGWFKFRPNTSLRPSLREIAVHSQLEKLRFKYQRQKLAQIPFIFGVLTQTNSTNQSTHTYDYRFLQIERERITPLELHITNLIHSSQNEYDDFIPFSIENSQNYNQLSGDMPLYTKELEQFVEAQLSQLKNISNDLDKSTKELRALEEDIQKLTQ